MSCVPAGTYEIGSNDSKWEDERPEHRIELDAFFIDQYEVSVRNYQKCVKAGECPMVKSNYRHMRKLEYPQLKVSWYNAAQYCSWRGKRLPTEAEFEAASRGPQGDLYSWGNKAPTCNLSIIRIGEVRGCVEDFAPTGSVSRVGSRPAGKYGLYDMTGNAHEWVSDWYLPYSECGSACFGKNPQGPCPGKNRCEKADLKVVKGGSWYWDEDWARAAKRRAHVPSNNPPHHFGFRCAVSATSATLVLQRDQELGLGGSER